MTISQKFNTVDTVKAQIKTAIENKGVTISSSDTFATYPSKISAIPDASEYIGYLDDIEGALDDLGVTVPASYADLDDTITNSYNDIYTELQSISGGTVPTSTINITENGTYNVADYASANVNVSGGSTPVISSLNVTPTTAAQMITAPSGIDGYNPINVDAITSSIDSNITAGNIKSGVSILGVTGNYEGSATLVTKNITQNGTYNASSDNADGYSSVTVNVSGGSGVGITREVDANGRYGFPTSNFTFSLPSNATDLRDSAMPYAFYNCTRLTSVDLSSLTTVSGFYAMQHAFSDCGELTSVDLSSLTTVSGANAMSYAFRNCINLASVNLLNLTTVSSGMAMQDAFQGCTGLTSIDLSSLTTVSGNYAMQHAFSGCAGLTSVDLSSLTTVSGNYAMQHAFINCTSLTSLSFPALTSNSFSSYTNQFYNMLKSVIGCTVHFPSNLQSVIGSWSDVTAGFGGTNTTVLFDLPATT